MPKAKAAVRRAIELDEDVAEAHATLGVIAGALRLGLGRAPSGS